MRGSGIWNRTRRERSTIARRRANGPAVGQVLAPRGPGSRLGPLRSSFDPPGIAAPPSSRVVFGLGLARSSCWAGGPPPGLRRSYSFSGEVVGVCLVMQIQRPALSTGCLSATPPLHRPFPLKGTVPMAKTVGDFLFARLQQWGVKQQKVSSQRPRSLIPRSCILSSPTSPKRELLQLGSALSFCAPFWPPPMKCYVSCGFL
jgi:hypothetical protein